MRSRNRWRRSNGCASRAEQILFKYCSTFDSTDAGNIGPVADALLESLGDSFTVACPAFPTNKRTVYLGHLFVGEQLLSDSPMKDHPLTPMRDSNLQRVLGQQTKSKVGLIALPTVRQVQQRCAKHSNNSRLPAMRTPSSTPWRMRICSRWARPLRNVRS
jgi:uncharacterized protein YgbK (DUF1537 family)